jgi:hypothetical protein
MPGRRISFKFWLRNNFCRRAKFFWGKKTKFETKVLKIRKLLIIANFNDGAKNLATLKIWQPRETAAAAAVTLVTATNLDHGYLREIDCSRDVSSDLLQQE